MRPGMQKKAEQSDGFKMVLLFPADLGLPEGCIVSILRVWPAFEQPIEVDYCAVEVAGRISGVTVTVKCIGTDRARLACFRLRGRWRRRSRVSRSSRVDRSCSAVTRVDWVT